MAKLLCVRRKLRMSANVEQQSAIAIRSSSGSMVTHLAPMAGYAACVYVGILETYSHLYMGRIHSASCSLLAVTAGRFTLAFRVHHHQRIKNDDGRCSLHLQASICHATTFEHQWCRMRRLQIEP